ncbi:MAG: HU family DNA-binding protein [Dehalococcoidia bacterium]|nr:HU family DNA-binding protein [Dehalococcoidia bacterium]
MTRAELIERVVAELGTNTQWGSMTKTRRRSLISSATEAIIKEVRRGLLDRIPVKIRGLGTFEPAVRKPKPAYNFAKGETMLTASKYGVSFRPSVSILEELNNGKVRSSH